MGEEKVDRIAIKLGATGKACVAAPALETLGVGPEVSLGGRG
jgi:hypothetical protein